MIRSVFGAVHGDGDGVHHAARCLLLLKSQQLRGTAISLSSLTFLFPKRIPNPHLAFLHSAADSSGGKRDGNRNRRSSPGLMNEISKLKTLDDALGFYNQMVRMRPLPTVIDFSQLLGRLVKMNHYSPAISLYRNMCVQGIRVDDYTMNTVINCYCLEGRVDLGFSLLGAFFKRGLVPNVITFATLLRGLFIQQMVSQAQELFSKIIFEKLCQPNVVMFGIVVDGLSKAGNMEMAIEFLRHMKNGDIKPNTIIYNSIIDGLCKDKMVDEAHSLLSEMIEKCIAPDVVTYNCLIQGFCNLGKWKEAEKLSTQMRDLKIVPNVITFNIMVDALCKEGKIKHAEDLIGIMNERGQPPDTVTYSALMDGYCLQGRIDEARKVFESMVASGLHPSAVSYTILINGYFKKRKTEDALDLFQEMASKGLARGIEIYNVILQGLFGVGRCAAARKLFNEMQAVVKPNFYTYCVMLDGLCKSGNVDEALHILCSMEADGVDLHITMYSIILDGLCKNGKLNCACDLFNSLSHRGLHPDITTYNVMLTGLFSEGLLTKAKNFVEKMKVTGCLADSITYNVIIKGLLKGGEYADAGAYHEEMIKRGFFLDSSTLSILLDLLNDKKKSIPVLKMMLKIDPNGKKFMDGV